MTVRLKMSQLNWKLDDPTEYVKKPLKDPPGQRVSPQLILSPAVQETLKRLDALGFNISDQAHAMRVTQYHSDPTLSGAIQDMSPEEYAKVYTEHIKGGPSPMNKPGPSQETTIPLNRLPQTNQALQTRKKLPQSPPAPTTLGATIRARWATLSMRHLGQGKQEMADLISLLMDAGLRMDDPQAAQAVLQELGATNSVYAPLATETVQLVKTDPASYEALMNQGALSSDYMTKPKLPENPESPAKLDVMTPEEQLKQLDLDILQAEGKEAKQELMQYRQQLRQYLLSKGKLPGTSAPAPMPAPAAPPPPAMTMQQLTAPPPPAAPPPAPSPEVSPTTMEQVIAPPTPAPPPPEVLPPAPATPPAAPSIPDTPINWQIGEGGARGKSKALDMFSDNYNQMATGLPPGMKPLSFGDSSGVQIFDEAAEATRATAIANGGTMVTKLAPERPHQSLGEAVVVGKAGPGQVAVRTFPGGRFEIWDVKGDNVHKSRNRLRRPP